MRLSRCRSSYCGGGGLAAILASLAVLAGAPGAAAADNATWRVIGKQGFVFRGHIKRVQLGQTKSFVHGLKVRTFGRRMTFSSLEIIYAGGEKQRVRRRVRLNNGEESRVIDVPEGGRFVDEVVLIPDVSAPRRNLIQVEILGLQSDVDAQRVRGQPEATAQEREATRSETAKSQVVVPARPAAATDKAAENKNADIADRSVATAPPSKAANGGRERAGTALEVANQDARVPALAEADATSRKAGQTASSTLENEPGAGSVTQEPSERVPEGQRPDTSDIANLDTQPNQATQQAAPPSKVQTGPPTKGGSLLVAATRLRPQEPQSVVDLGPSAAALDKFAFRISGGSFFVEDVKIHYDEGVAGAVRFGTQLFRNTRSRWIPADPKRIVRKIVIRHRSIDQTRRSVPRVEVLAHVGDRWLAPDGGAHRLSRGDWILLAARSINDLQHNRGWLPAARNRGGFRKMRAISTAGRLAERTLTVVFADGKKQELPAPTRQRASRDHPTGRELNNTAPIERLKIAVSERTLSRLSGNARFEVWVKF